MSSSKANVTENTSDCCEICHRPPQNLDLGYWEYECLKCGKKFDSEACLGKHFLEHVFWTCGECGRNFESPGAEHDCAAREPQEEDPGRSRLVPAANGTYVREYTPGVKCEVCAKVFASSAVLERHLRSHTKERPYGCELCDKRFRFASQQREHVREHTGEKPFACHLCSRTYARRAQLRRHVALHSESRLIVCLDCERGFTCEKSYMSHFEEHDKTEVKPNNI